MERYEVIKSVLLEDRFNKDSQLSGVEVGVRHGENAKRLLQEFPSLVLVLVDPYCAYQDVEEFYTEEKQLVIEQAAHKNLQEFEGQTIWVKSSSVSAAYHLISTYDFIFLDGNHSYDAIRQDMALWWDHVAPGGFLMGHDYSMDGVTKAVNEFATVLNVSFKTSDTEADVWWIKKGF